MCSHTKFKNVGFNDSNLWKKDGESNLSATNVSKKLKEILWNS